MANPERQKVLPYLQSFTKVLWPSFYQEMAFFKKFAFQFAAANTDLLLIWICYCYYY